MRFIPTRIHGLVDYLWGALLGASPWLFGFAGNGPATYVAWLFAAGAVLYSLATRYELGILPLVPVPAHLVLDIAAGAFLAASPWIFGFAGTVFWPHLLFGLFSVAAGLTTERAPRSGRSSAGPRPAL